MDQLKCVVWMLKINYTYRVDRYLTQSSCWRIYRLIFSIFVHSAIVFHFSFLLLLFGKFSVPSV